MVLPRLDHCPVSSTVMAQPAYMLAASVCVWGFVGLLDSADCRRMAPLQYRGVDFFSTENHGMESPCFPAWERWPEAAGGETFVPSVLCQVSDFKTDILGINESVAVLSSIRALAGLAQNYQATSGTRSGQALNGRRKKRESSSIPNRSDLHVAPCHGKSGLRKALDRRRRVRRLGTINRGK